MKRLVSVTVSGGLVVAAAAALAACTSDSSGSGSDGMSSKQLASDIQYDNAGTGLMSTNVQDAIDDVVAMAQAQEDRASRSVIVCKFVTANMTLPSTGNVQFIPHTFTTAECGGTLPDTTYVGAVSRFTSCNTVLGVWVMNVGEADGPGVTLRGYGGCNGPAEISAIFLKAK